MTMVIDFRLYRRRNQSPKLIRSVWDHILHQVRAGGAFMTVQILARRCPTGRESKAEAYQFRFINLLYDGHVLQQLACLLQRGFAS